MVVCLLTVFLLLVYRFAWVLFGFNFVLLSLLICCCVFVMLLVVIGLVVTLWLLGVF